MKIYRENNFLFDNEISVNKKMVIFPRLKFQIIYSFVSKYLFKKLFLL